MFTHVCKKQSSEYRHLPHTVYLLTVLTKKNTATTSVRTESDFGLYCLLERLQKSADDQIVIGALG